MPTHAAGVISMISRFRRLAATAVAVVILGSLGATTAMAGAPERVVEEVHIAGTFPAGTRCPFEVERTIDGTLVTTTFTGPDGLTTEMRSFKDGKIVYRNPANGKTLTAVLAGPVVTRDNGDGTSTIRIPGNDQRYTAPGLGFIVGNTGLYIETFDTATGATLSVDKTAGHQDGTPFPALCVGLE
ncbi:MAG TPA: hypothetical protein VFY18_08625 [Candidatus Limnocylindrales bacterium]|nr:hypothetical protein [Candidatus Limnocylindrales bacterium]